MMSDTELNLPLIWPDSRKLGGCSVPSPDLNSLFADSCLILGVVYGVTEGSVIRLGRLLADKAASTTSGNGHADTIRPDKKIRIIVTLYPTCPTTSETLAALLRLQTQHPALEIRLVTCELLSIPENIVACYREQGALPTLLVGSSANWEDLKDKLNHLTLGFTPDPTLASEWVNWFDFRWHKAAPLTQSRQAIPHLVLPEGTFEAAEKWARYKELCRADQEKEAPTITVDSKNGEVSVQTAGGVRVATVSTESKITKVSPVYRKLSHLFRMGHLVSVDKTTRLPPFEVSVKPRWFGLETLKQIGSVKRQVSYHISALTPEELKQLENRRKKTSELQDLFCFSLADAQRWMPLTAESLFRQEQERINAEGKDSLTKLIAGNLDKFMESRRDAISRDANSMYRDLFPNHDLSKTALDEIMEAIKARLAEAQIGSFLPQLSFNSVGLPQPENSAWKSQLGSALHLLLSIARYPRKAVQNGLYFGRGMKAKPLEIVKSMNVLNDPFIRLYEKGRAEDTAKEELASIEEIAESMDEAEDKCRRLLEIMGQ